MLRLRHAATQGSTGPKTGRMPTSGVNFGEGKILLPAVLCGQPTWHIFLVWVQNFRFIEAQLQQSDQVATRAVFTGLGQVQPLHCHHHHLQYQCTYSETQTDQKLDPILHHH